MNNSELDNIIFFVTNIFGTYIIYRYLRIFFSDLSKNKLAEFFSYLGYYIIISLTPLVISDTYINFILELMLLFFISLNYKSSIRKKILVTFLIYAILLAVESFVTVLILVVKFDHPNYSNIIILLATKIISFVIALAFGNFKYVKNDIRIPLYRWISILFFPLGSLILFYVIISEPNKNNILVALIILLLFNLLMFYVYEILNREHQIAIEYKMKENEAALFFQKSMQYERQLEVMNVFHEKIRMIKHNYNNDLIVLKNLMLSPKKDDALKYLKDMEMAISNKVMYSNSGNIAVDSLLNYKLSEAEDFDIKLTLNIKIPIILNITANDLSVILGCILDNAIEALYEAKDKVLDIDIGYDRGVLYICMCNSYASKLLSVGSTYDTTKQDKQNHGLGLTSVRLIVEKYNGELLINDSDGFFSVNLMIYDR